MTELPAKQPLPSGPLPCWTRRRVLAALVLAPLAPRTPAVLPVITRRLLIPAPGATLPVLLFRPSAPGRYPAVMLLPRAGSADGRDLAARLAAAGRVVMAPLRLRHRESETTAISRYLKSHSATHGEPETRHC